MVNINNNGELKMDNENYLNIKKKIDNGINPKIALEEELNKENIALKDVRSLIANMRQMSDKEIVEIYSMLVCEFWNN